MLSLSLLCRCRWTYPMHCLVLCSLSFISFVMFFTLLLWQLLLKREVRLMCRRKGILNPTTVQQRHARNQQVKKKGGRGKWRDIQTSYLIFILACFAKTVQDWRYHLFHQICAKSVILTKANVWKDYLERKISCVRLVLGSGWDGRRLLRNVVEDVLFHRSLSW